MRIRKPFFRFSLTHEGRTQSSQAAFFNRLLHTRPSLFRCPVPSHHRRHIFSIQTEAQLSLHRVHSGANEHESWRNPVCTPRRAGLTSQRNTHGVPSPSCDPRFAGSNRTEGKEPQGYRTYPTGPIEIGTVFSRAFDRYIRTAGKSKVTCSPWCVAYIIQTNLESVHLVVSGLDPTDAVYFRPFYREAIPRFTSRSRPQNCRTLIVSLNHKSVASTLGSGKKRGVRGARPRLKTTP